MCHFALPLDALGSRMYSHSRQDVRPIIDMRTKGALYVACPPGERPLELFRLRLSNMHMFFLFVSYLTARVHTKSWFTVSYSLDISISMLEHLLASTSYMMSVGILHKMRCLKKFHPRILFNGAT